MHYRAYDAFITLFRTHLNDMKKISVPFQFHGEGGSGQHPVPASSLLSILNPFHNLFKLIRRWLWHYIIWYMLLCPFKLTQKFLSIRFI